MLNDELWVVGCGLWVVGCGLWEEDESPNGDGLIYWIPNPQHQLLAVEPQKLVLGKVSPE